MLQLESFDNINEVVEFDPMTGQIQWHPRQANAQVAPRITQGIVSRIDKHVIMLYRLGENLHLRVDNFDVELTQEVQIHLSRGEFNVLNIIKDGKTIFQFEYQAYQPDEIDQWRMYLDPFIEKEHLDFGEFIANVAKDIKQRDRAYR